MNIVNGLKGKKLEKISIVMPVHNAATTLEESINSVLSQSYKNFELIIIDDFSSDTSLDILEEILSIDSRINLIKNKKNIGVAESRNIGVSNSSGKYIAFLDADDKWNKDKLKRQLVFMVKNKSQFSFMNYELINSKGFIIGERFGKDKHIDFKKMIRGNQVGLLTVMIESQVIKKYSMPHIGHEDYATWIAMTKDNVIVDYLETSKSMAQYRIHKSISSNKFKTIIWTWKIYRNVAKLNYFSSIVSMLFFIKNVISRKNRK
ncbi:glycosyltransferase family 2 protein [Dellaglioa sp. L3N]